jgi:glutamate formiminotransferase / 5-formyltetrahydrofolate cyclo-ligase
MTLLAFPNFSEGRDEGRIARLVEAFSGVEVLDVHSDPLHNRTAVTLAGEGAALAAALVAGADAAIAAIDMNGHTGAHPCVGALDVCAVVWPAPGDREAATALALEVAATIGTLGVPVFLYGDLASSQERRERFFFRRGGLEELRRRMAAGEIVPDEGPAEPHPTAGATLVTARRPLVAFNVELDSGDLNVAESVAADLRESGGGLPGVRALGLPIDERRSQVSTNIHDPGAVPLRVVVERVRELAAVHGAKPVAAELVGLAPAAALAGYPDDVPIEGFDPSLHLIENRLK